MNILAEFASMIESGMTPSLCVSVCGDKVKGNSLWTRYNRTEDKFAWYLSLTLEESDRLYLLLLRKAGERREERKAKRREKYERRGC